MAFIRPDTTIWLIGGCELSPDYKHTFLFKSKAAQYRYFTDRGYRLSNYNYTNFSDNVIRIGNMSGNNIGDEFLTYNYMMFKNYSSDNSSKTYYAFIINAKRIGNNCIEYTYQIDVMQTYWFDFEMPPCMVEREHTKTDNVFEHTVPEPVSGGELICSHTDDRKPNLKQYLYILYTDNSGSNGFFYSRVFSGLKVKVIEITNYGYGGTRTQINTAIDEIISSSGQVVAMYQTPYSYSVEIEGAEQGIGHEGRGVPIYRELAKSWGGYTPKNRKLYTSQYCNIVATNHNGTVKTYKPELFNQFSIGGDPYNFSDMTFSFDLYFTPAPTPTMMLIPRYYNGFGHSRYIPDYYPTDEADYNPQSADNGLMLTEFPVCSWQSDAYQAWWAQNKNSYVTGMVVDSVKGAYNIASQGKNLVVGAGRVAAGDLIGGASQVAGSDVVGATIDTAGKIANNIAVIGDMKNTPDNLGGMAQAQNISGYLLLNDIDLRVMSVKPEYAKQVDDYFTLYGYQVNTLKTPNVKNAQNDEGDFIPDGIRPYWNYVKTNGAIIHPILGNFMFGIPAEYEKMITNIFDNGITFWVQTEYGDNNIGDYSKDNLPITYSPFNIGE